MTGGCHTRAADVTISTGISRQNAIANDDPCAAIDTVDRLRTSVVADRRILNSDRSTGIANRAARDAVALIAADSCVGEGRISAHVVNPIVVLDQCSPLKAQCPRAVINAIGTVLDDKP